MTMDDLEPSVIVEDRIVERGRKKKKKRDKR
jgi:hypothetical protein